MSSERSRRENAPWEAWLTAARKACCLAAVKAAAPGSGRRAVKEAAGSRAPAPLLLNTCERMMESPQITLAVSTAGRLES